MDGRGPAAARQKPRRRGAAARFLIPGVVLLGLLGLFASSAEAAFDIVNNYEPPYTKGTSNTWWFNWSNPGYTGNRICYTEYVNNTSQGYEGDGCVTSSSNGFYSKAHSGLASGSTYGECAEDQENQLFAPSWVDDGDAGPCWNTTMDNAAPNSVATGVDGTATYTNNPNMTLSIFYQDAVSPPWFYSQGSTFDCWRRDSNTTSKGCENAPGSGDVFQNDPGCSSPTSNTSKNSNWSCTYNISSLNNFRDGTWYYCVREADSAFPDNSATQNPSHSPSEANISPDTPSGCGSIILDRVPPTVTPSTANTSVHTGDLVSFNATGSDPAGVSGYSWNFGDNTAGASGQSASHTYTTAGTYQVTASANDGAGNAGSGQLTMTVTGPTIGGGGGSGGNGSGGNGSGSGGTGGGSSGAKKKCKKGHKLKHGKCVKKH